MDDLDTLVQEKIENDTEFQSSLDGLEDDEREVAVETKRKEVLSQEFKTLKEKADEADKAKELADNYKIRAEKAEKAGKTPKETENLDNKDIVYLAKADIHEEDTDEVLDFAKIKKISVREAHEYLKPVLAVRDEQRKTALATNTTTSQRGGSKIDGSTLLQNASKGKLPEDEAGIEALVAAEIAQKTRK